MIVLKNSICSFQYSSFQFVLLKSLKMNSKAQLYMKIVLSAAKSLNFEQELPTTQYTASSFLKESR
jgi:hypothetical protein